MIPALISQLVLLVYHQATTWLDLHPFNGVRNYTRSEQFTEAGANAVLMSVAPIGFGFHIKGLMSFGVVYYFVLFAVELLIWWVPYFTVPSGLWRTLYNGLLAVVTSNFEKGDTLNHWIAIHRRLHQGTTCLLPARADRPVPNLEHMILHGWTLVTALVTLAAYRHLPG